MKIKLRVEAFPAVSNNHHQAFWSIKLGLKGELH